MPTIDQLIDAGGVGLAIVLASLLFYVITKQRTNINGKFTISQIEEMSKVMHEVVDSRIQRLKENDFEHLQTEMKETNKKLDQLINIIEAGQQSKLDLNKKVTYLYEEKLRGH